MRDTSNRPLSLVLILWPRIQTKKKAHESRTKPHHLCKFIKTSRPWCKKRGGEKNRVKICLNPWKYDAVLRGAELQIVGRAQGAIPCEQQCEAHVWCGLGKREWRENERKRVWLIMWAMGACESCRKLLHRRPSNSDLKPRDSEPTSGCA